MRVKVVQIETHVADACNLTCHGCTHFSQEGHSGREMVESFRRHNEEWAGRLDPRYFLVLGGEPTLNPDLCDILVECRRLWKDAEIRLVTNGFFLHRHPRLAQVLPEQRIRLDVSIHHDDPRYVAKLKEIANLVGSWEIPIVWRESFKDWKAYYQGEGKDARPFADGQPQQSWNHCESRWCMTIKDGKLYKCPLTAHLGDHVRKFGDVCQACDGEGSLMMQWGKAAMLKVGGSTRPLSDGRKGVYYVDAQGREMGLKTIGGSCSVCNGTGKAGWAPYLAYRPLEQGCTDAELAEFTGRKAEDCCRMCPANPKHLAKPYPVRERSKT